MNRWEKLYYVGENAKESAVLQGNILVEAYKKDPASLDLNGDGKVSYVLLEGETSHQDSLIRTEWSIQTLKDGGVPLEKITGGIGNWEKSQGSAWIRTKSNSLSAIMTTWRLARRRRWRGRKSRGPSRLSGSTEHPREWKDLSRESFLELSSVTAMSMEA